MRKHHAFLILLVMTCSALAAWADVPPDPGYKRVSVNLIVEPADEFPDHRFFIRTGAQLEELSLRKGQPHTIEPMGGGAWYRAGTLIAVPKKSLEGLNETRTGGKLSEMKQLVYDGKAAGLVELIKHSFIRDVLFIEAASIKDAAYRIEKDAENNPKAVPVSGGANEKDLRPSSVPGLYSTEVKTPMFWASVVGGSLLTFAFIGLGVWYIRRSRIA